MIVLIKDDNGERTTSFQHCKSRLEEVELFQQVIVRFRNLHNEILKDKSPSVQSYFHRSNNTMTLRLIDNMETVDIVAMLNDHGDLLKKDWVFENTVVENRQGGTTHNQGWILS